MKHLLIYTFLILVITSCSTTKHFPEEEVLYRGIKKINVENEDKTSTGKDVMDEVNGALAYKPNNSLFGSSSATWWPPIGLWIYNNFKKYDSGIGKWIFNKLASKPVFITTVNPELRVKVAQNLLRDYGYFNGVVDYQIDTLKNKRKAKITYDVDMRNPYLLDSVMYQGFSFRADSLIRAHWNERLFHDGDNFSVVTLENERQRLSSLFRNNGYFYHRPEYTIYLADTLIRSGKASLKILPESRLPWGVNKQWYLGKTSISLVGFNGEIPTDSLMYKGLKILYSGKKPPVRPSVLSRRLRYKEGELYSQRKQLSTQESYARLGVFRYSELQYTPRDTSVVNNDTLDIRLNAALDLPLNGELEVNFTSKSNDMLGPGAVFGISKRNFFRGGETFSVRLRGSYEWQTNSSVEGKKADINSYELGISTSLEFPSIVFPWLHRKNFNYPATTTFRLSADLLNRASFFRIYSFGANAIYNFQPNIRNKHSITPFKLTYNQLKSTERFNDIMEANPALYLSMQSQFIPAMSYTYTYDDGKVVSKRNHIWWETSFTSAGNLLSGVYAIAGDKFNTKDKTLFGNSYAQFLKLTSEIRYNMRINSNQSLVTRFMAGAVYAYGNSASAPYTEQFYIGGANSIRAFTVRTVGPGSYRSANITRYSYIDQTGDLKLEANVEYRFTIVGDLNGAAFIDSGNVWLLKKNEKKPGGEFKISNLGKDIALGTGLGLRYDLTFLVVRFDVGVGIHTPYDTGKSGYYNIPRFKDGLSYHLAIGYPF